jgi:hypothetical protein
MRRQRPSAARRRATDLAGRGLWIVDQTVTKWGITRAGGRSAVWFEMAEQPKDPACPLAATT